MSDRRRKYSTESSDDSYQKSKRKKKSKKNHKDHKKKHKKDRREERRSSRDRARKKRRPDSSSPHREHYRKNDKYCDRERSNKCEKKYSESVEKRSSDAHETKEPEIPMPIHKHTTICDEQKPEEPCTSNVLPSYYNVNVVSAKKFQEQQQKRKLLWQGKRNESAAQQPTQWTNLKFSQDTDGTKANKFMRLMGIKEVKEDNLAQPNTVQKSEEISSRLEQQYEVARNITHLSRGIGFGYK